MIIDVLGKAIIDRQGQRLLQHVEYRLGVITHGLVLGVLCAVVTRPTPYTTEGLGLGA